MVDKEMQYLFDVLAQTDKDYVKGFEILNVSIEPSLVNLHKGEIHINLENSEQKELDIYIKKVNSSYLILAIQEDKINSAKFTVSSLFDVIPSLTNIEEVIESRNSFIEEKQIKEKLESQLRDLK